MVVDHLDAMHSIKNNLTTKELKFQDDIAKRDETISAMEARLAALKSSSENLAKKELQDLEVQTEKVEDAQQANVISTLQKDLFYYRNANKYFSRNHRDLKTKLREVVAVNHKLAKSLEDPISYAKAVEKS